MNTVKAKSKLIYRFIVALHAILIFIKNPNTDPPHSNFQVLSTCVNALSETNKKSDNLYLIDPDRKYKQKNVNHLTPYRARLASGGE